jgi:hypothetical protein
LAPGKLREDKLPVWGGGSVHLAPLDGEAGRYLWLDPIVPSDLAERHLRRRGPWCGTRRDAGGDRVVTESGRLVKNLGVVHLIPGCPVEAMVSLGKSSVNAIAFVNRAAGGRRAISRDFADG